MPARSIQTIGDHSNLLVTKAIIRRFSPTGQSINILLATGGSKRVTNQSLALCEWGFSHLTLPLIYKWLMVMRLQNPSIHNILHNVYMQQRGRVTIKLATLDVNFAALYSDTVILGVKFYQQNQQAVFFWQI